MTTKDFERIDSLLKLCEEHQKNLRASLQKTTQRVMEVKTQMNIRCTQIWGKLEHIRERFDKIHRSNQSFLDKIKEKLDEINAQEMEANRENDEFRRKAVFIRRQRRKHGLIRSIGSSIYNYGISILTFIGWYKPVKKAPKETKKQQGLPHFILFIEMNFVLKTSLIIALFYVIDSVTTLESFPGKFTKVSVSDDCETNPESEKIFGQRVNFYEDDTGNVFCFRKKEGGIRMSSTSRSFEDPRFMCSKGPMSWYRGRRNMDFKDRPCLFWSNFPNSTFDISDSSSSSYSMKRILPDEYENFCRNPDKNPLGPWCHVAGGLKVPCFEPCRPSTESSSEFVCLNRDGFPYTEYEMSDVLDLPQLIGVFENVQLMYESRFVLPVEVDRLSTKSCINKGNIATRFGPWIAVLNEIAKDFLKTIGRRVLRDLCAPINSVELSTRYQGILYDAIIEDEFTVSGCLFWRRCFSSCQDDISTCWLKNQTSYFGSKTTSTSGKGCLPWTQVSSEILKMTKGNVTSSDNYRLYNDLLFEDSNRFFVESRLFMNTENSCMLLNRRNSTEMDKSYIENPYFSKEKWNDEFKKMFQQGPGCFVKQNKTIEFELCYSDCEKHPKVQLTKPLCLEKNKYSICKPQRGEDWLKRGRKVE
ncbi:hypothetical protein GCK72_002419 [Caenorhabditis remanei]|uniref:Kringle domain-containing protein n=1 Tax=Caenorhabditis remanei TaxID=31234 RepID=A0A6A5HQW0_CAERE|nr:hypothetical protein GCK72_002419 [Caenorhabditis remanei]KAF1770600.1 hypothetical protein GCK72_002419 [Caenorhabditis remanei]